MAQSIKLGSDTFLDASGVVMSDHSTLDTAHTRYTKLPDGTMIQWGHNTFNAASTGNQLTTVDYPVSFTGVPYVLCSWADSTNIPNYVKDLQVISGNSAQTTTKDHAVFSCTRIQANYAWEFEWIAIGRWK